MELKKIEIARVSLWAIAIAYFMAGMSFMFFFLSPKPATASKPVELHNHVYLISYLLKDSNGNFGFGNATITLCNQPFKADMLRDVERKVMAEPSSYKTTRFSTVAVSLIEDTVIAECPKQE